MGKMIEIDEDHLVDLHKQADALRDKCIAFERAANRYFQTIKKIHDCLYMGHIEEAIKLARRGAQQR